MPGGIVLEDYLVRLGFNLNATGLNQFIELIGKGKRQITSMIPMLNNNLVKATFTTGSFLATVAIGTMKLMEAVAQADIELEVFARKMWMNEEAARGMSAAAEALGYSLDDLSSIALSPELTNQFRELYDITKNVRPPEELQEHLQQIREVSFEWKKFGVLAKYSVHWVTYYLSKYLNKELGDAKRYLKAFNEWFEQNIPRIAKVIASFLANAIRMTASFFKFLKLIWGMVSSVLGVLETILGLTEGSLLKAIVLIGAAIFIASSPLLSITAVIIGIVALVDDLMTYLEGGNSLLGGIWSGAVSFIKGFIDGLKLVYYYARLVAAVLKDVFTLNWDLPSVKEWTDKIKGVTVDYIPKSAESKSESGWAAGNSNVHNENNSSYNQNVYVYSNDPKSAGSQVAKQTEIILNRGLGG